MKMHSKLLNVWIELKRDKTNSIILESPKIYREVVDNLLLSVQEDNDDWVFYDGEIEISKNKKLDVVDTVFSLDFNSRKIQKCIIDNIYQIAMDEAHFIKTQEISNKLTEYMYELEYELPYNVKISAEDFHDIIKIAIDGIEASENVLDRFDDYIKVISRLLCCNILILIGIQEYFEKEEWNQILQLVENEEMYLICIERRDNYGDDNRIIIDADWCRVV